MDAVKFLREYNRMCQAFNCKNCPVSDMGSDEELYTEAVSLAKEAIQVAAMALKLA